MTDTSNNVGLNTNNPGNLLYGTPWNGVVGAYNSPNGLSYSVFDSPQSGWAALATDLTTAINEGYNNLTGLVAHYLGQPATSSAVTNYVRTVSNSTGISPTQQLSASDVPNLAQGFSVAEGTSSLGGSSAATANTSSGAKSTDPVTSVLNYISNALNPAESIAEFFQSIFNLNITERVFAGWIGVSLIVIALLAVVFSSKTVQQTVIRPAIKAGKEAATAAVVA